MDLDTIIIIFNVIFYLLVFIFGAVIGSFLNVCILRLPRGESLITNNSHCMTCGTEIKRYDLIPILSWCILGGKCRACKAPISPRYTVVETLTAVLFVLCYAFFPVETYGIYFACLALFISGMIVLAFQDIDNREMCLSVIIYTFIIAAATYGLSFITLQDGSKLLTIPVTIKEQLIGLVSVPLILLIFGFVLTPVFYVLFKSQDHKDLRRLKKARKTEKNESKLNKIDREIEKVQKSIKENGPVFGFGMGDILIMVSGGFMIGWKASAVATAIAIAFGAIYAVIQVVKQEDAEEKDNAFAFGPFLITGLIIASYVGTTLADMYINATFIF